MSVLWSSACRIHTPGVLAPGGEAPRVQKAIPVAFSSKKLHRGVPGAARPSQPYPDAGTGARGEPDGGQGRAQLRALESGAQRAQTMAV